MRPSIHAALKLAVLALAALLSCAPPAAAQDVVPLPRWTSDLVRDARPLGPADAWTFLVAGAGGEPQQVSLAPTFVSARAGTSAWVYDRTLCREFTWTTGGRDLASTSCYPAPVAESLTAGAARSVRRRTEGKTVEYREGSDLIARVRGELARLDPETASRFAVYLARRTELDPLVRRDLVKSAVLPEVIEIYGSRDGKRRRQNLAFSELRPLRLAYPLPAGLTAYPALQRQASPSTTAQAGIDAAVLASEERFPLARPSLQTLLANMHAALNQKKPMAALFWFLELSQQYTGYLLSSPSSNPATEARVLLRQTLADPEAARFFAASNVAGQPGAAAGRTAAARYLAGLQLQGVPFATFRDVTFANLVQGAPGAQVNPEVLKLMPGPLTDLYWRHIAAYPWAGNVYKDLGDAYFRANDPYDAWLAYDLGRAVDHEWKGGVLQGVAALEARIRTAAPDFF